MSMNDATVKLLLDSSTRRNNLNLHAAVYHDAMVNAVDAVVRNKGRPAAGAGGQSIDAAELAIWPIVTGRASVAVGR